MANPGRRSFELAAEHCADLVAQLYRSLRRCPPKSQNNVPPRERPPRQTIGACAERRGLVDFAGERNRKFADRERSAAHDPDPKGLVSAKCVAVIRDACPRALDRGITRKQQAEARRLLNLRPSRFRARRARLLGDYGHLARNSRRKPVTGNRSLADIASTFGPPGEISRSSDAIATGGAKAGIMRDWLLPRRVQ